MAAFVIGALVVLVGLILTIRWFVTAEPRDILRVLRVAGAIVLGLLVVVLVLVRQWSWLSALLLLLLPLLGKFGALKHIRKNAAGPTPGNTSAVETDFLTMSLDHDSGAMDGTVKQGAFAGRRVGELSLMELVELRDECVGADPQAVAILEAFLDRRFGSDWRDAAEQSTNDGAARSDGPMTADEAYEVLGLPRGADREEVERAYRQMMQKLHPDHGGSDYLASKINQAKNVLLGR